MITPEIQNVVCVVGVTKDNKPIWKKVGIRTITKTFSKEVILLDRTFNPAGVAIEENNKNSVALYIFKQNSQEFRNKEAYLKPNPEKLSNQKSYFEDFKDDAPF